MSAGGAGAEEAGPKCGGRAGPPAPLRSRRPALTASSCRMCSVVASRARVPLVASSSTAFTVLSRDVTLVTITCGHQRREGGPV